MKHVKRPMNFALSDLGVAFAAGTMLLFLCAQSQACKYSVRDVGFVNMHGRAWQLRIVKPEKIDNATFEKWTATIQSSLKNSNVGFEWVKRSSEQGDEVMSLFEPDPPNTQPQIGLIGSDGNIIPLHLDKNDLAKTLKTLVNSPAREKILNFVPESLCVIVVVEGKSESEHDASAIAAKAATKIEKQMWTLEKATRDGPSVITIRADQREQEKWLLRSLGIDTVSDEPAIAIVYGQGRRLGDVLTGDKISLANVVDRAKLCGSSCECALDRDWLYGVQMVHHWGIERERAAESSLQFDPQSALVVAEVNQMIRRPSNNSGRRSIGIGSGLVIHDLEELNSNQNENEIDESQNEVLNENKASVPQAISNSSQPGDEPQSDSNYFQWIMLAGLAFLVLLTAGFTMLRKGSM